MSPLSNQRRHSQDETRQTDPETNQLIPTRKRRHRVRVQGRLAVVRSVSTANLRPAASVPPVLPSPVDTSGTTTPATPKFESGVAGVTVAPVRRRKSLDDASNNTEEEDVTETVVRDRQFRGYGIGGAGNIRRPTEVYGSAKSGSLSRFSIFQPSVSSDEFDKRPWSLKDLKLFGRTADRKGKGVQA
ncbi:hypothetical protein CCHL11_09918 [Colletotrichum chlorophyti]|uniref:Uncharacterized protein n=1 Tax=Colletotrichum chlorophyti TaxID=708187 RepID=A0A1Q8RNE6_9PEZI|nr:hypothetical protein CCHL11_09918 [Colletotrichum chlorophyti]